MSIGCDCPEVHYAAPVRCDDHEARRAEAWAQIDARLADKYLDVMLLAKELNAAPGAVHRFVKVRRKLLELSGQPTLPGDCLDVIDQLLELDSWSSTGSTSCCTSVSPAGSLTSWPPEWT